MSELAEQDQTNTTPSFFLDSTNTSNQDTLQKNQQYQKLQKH